LEADGFVAEVPKRVRRLIFRFPMLSCRASRRHFSENGEEEERKKQGRSLRGKRSKLMLACCCYAPPQKLSALDDPTDERSQYDNAMATSA
jgi:hypothetical protein